MLYKVVWKNDISTAKLRLSFQRNNIKTIICNYKLAMKSTTAYPNKKYQGKVVALDIHTKHPPETRVLKIIPALKGYEVTPNV